LFLLGFLDTLKVGNESSKGASFMKKLLAVLAVFALSLAVMARPQSGSQPSDQSSPSQSQTKPSDQGQSNTSSATGQGQSQGQGQKMTGTVSKDGKTFTNDSDSKKYKVSNPDALQGHEGQQVSLILAVDPDTNTVHIIQVGGPQ
jgi:hypothetical protein